MTIYRIGTSGYPVLDDGSFTLEVTGLDIQALAPDHPELEGEHYFLIITGGEDEPLHLLDGLYSNLMYGAIGVPHGDVEAESFLTAPLVADTSTTIAVREEECPRARLLDPGVFLAIMDDYPTALRHQDQTNFEIVRVSPSYPGGLSADIVGFGAGGAVLYNHPAEAIVQRVKGFPSSVGLNGIPGVRTALSRPAAVTNLEGTPAGSYAFNLTWDEHPNWHSKDAPGLVQYFDVYVLKHGEGISIKGMPAGAGALMLPVLEDIEPDPSGDIHSVAGVNQYYNQTTKTVDNITVADTYYVFVYPKAETGKKYNSLLGLPASARVDVTA